MMLAWMLFAIEISALLFAAACCAERAVLALRQPVRWIWVATIVAANVLPILLVKLALPAWMQAHWAFPVSPDSALSRFSVPVLVLWSIAIVAGIGFCAAAILRVSQARPEWRNEHVDNTPVLVSHDIGPALVGVMQYSIVVPRWAYSLEERARRLLLAHEREHAREYDPMLLAGAAFAVVLAPWNVFNWIFMRRLHLAVELDCDQRVLRAHPDTHGYSALLLDVAERVIPSVMPAAAFVEHGASLEARLNAMNHVPKTFRSLRTAAGMATSVVFIAAACFTPRPYIIVVNSSLQAPGDLPVKYDARVVVVDPKTNEVRSGVARTVRMLDSAASEPATNASTNPAAGQAQPQAKATPASTLGERRAAQAAHGTSGAVSTGSAKASEGVGAYAGPREVWPVAPSARVKALDDAEIARMRAMVLQEQRNPLGNWPRADSALLLLFDSNRRVVKRATIARGRMIEGREAAAAFSASLVMPDVMNVGASAIMHLDRGVNGEVLSEPLVVYVGYLYPGVSVPKMISEVTPTRDEMLAVLRKRHPDLLADTVPGATVGMLLYDSRGNLLKTAAIVTDNGMTLPDGSVNADYERQARRKAFGSAMDSGVLVLNGTYTLHSGKPLRQGPAKMMYAMQAQHSDILAMRRQVQSRIDHQVISGSGWSTRNGQKIDSDALKIRLRELVQSRVPDAFGDWARGDSAVLLILNSKHELVARRTLAIPKDDNFNTQEVIATRMVTLPVGEMSASGYETFGASAAGRVLDKPLVVFWGMVFRDTKWLPPTEQ